MNGFFKIYVQGADLMTIREFMAFSEVELLEIQIQECGRRDAMQLSVHKVTDTEEGTISAIIAVLMRKRHGWKVIALDGLVLSREE